MSGVRERLGHVLELAQCIGWFAAVDLVARRMLGLRKPVIVTWREHSLTVRPCDSDPFVLVQMFTRREYDPMPFWMARLNAAAAELRERGRVPLIVDAGANVGYSALYLAVHFPDAIVVAVEPDPACVEMIKVNSVDCQRIRVVHAALWSHEGGVNLITPDGGSWANRVSDGGRTPSVTLDSLLASVPGAAPLILKLDIEGAETEVCRSAPQRISEFACIMIEPHDWMLPGSGGLSPLYEAVAGKKTDTLIRREVLMLFDCVVAADPELITENSHSST